MATGYTYIVGERDVSFAEFVWRCARGFGALIHMRDDSLESTITMPERSTYHIDIANKLKNELELYSNISLEKASLLMKQENDDRKSMAKIELEKWAITQKRFSDMLSKVKEWKSPSKEHDRFKEFMIEQLQSSIDFMGNEYYLGLLNKPDLTVQKWLDDKISLIKDDIKYHLSHQETDDKNHKSRVDWINLLKESVPLTDPI